MSVPGKTFTRTPTEVTKRINAAIASFQGTRRFGCPPDEEYIFTEESALMEYIRRVVNAHWDVLWKSDKGVVSSVFTGIGGTRLGIQPVPQGRKYVVKALETDQERPQNQARAQMLRSVWGV